MAPDDDGEEGEEDEEFCESILVNDCCDPACLDPKQVSNLWFLRFAP